MCNTPGTRFKQLICKNISKKIKKKKLMFLKKKSLGYNSFGKKVARFKSFKNKNYDYRLNYLKKDIKYLGLIVSIFQTVFKSSFISLIRYLNGSYCYIPTIHGMKIGGLVSSLNIFNFSKINKKFFKPGSIIFLKLLPRYSIFSNLKIDGNEKPTYARSAGTYCQLLEKIPDYRIATIKLPTGKSRIINLFSYVSIGRNSNILNKYVVFGKAGIKRLKGCKPTVRGVAMNPVDHPNGGRTKSCKPEKSLWGWIAKKNC